MIKVGTTLKDGTIYVGPIKDQHLILKKINIKGLSGQARILKMKDPPI